MLTTFMFLFYRFPAYLHNLYFQGFSTLNQSWYLSQMAMPNQGQAATPLPKLEKISDSSDSDSDSDSMDSQKQKKKK